MPLAGTPRTVSVLKCQIQNAPSESTMVQIEFVVSGAFPCQPGGNQRAVWYISKNLSSLS
jgi:hypothetical protein